MKGITFKNLISDELANAALARIYPVWQGTDQDRYLFKNLCRWGGRVASGNLSSRAQIHKRFMSYVSKNCEKAAEANRLFQNKPEKELKEIYEAANNRMHDDFDGA